MCIAITKKNIKCKKKAIPNSEYCHIHNNTDYKLKNDNEIEKLKNENEKLKNELANANEYIDEIENLALRYKKIIHFENINNNLYKYDDRFIYNKHLLNNFLKTFDPILYKIFKIEPNKKINFLNLYHDLRLERNNLAHAA